MKHRFLCLTLCLVLLLTALASCGLNTTPITLEKSMPLPADGIIPASLLSRLHDENKVIVITGESAGVRFEWTLFGADVKEPADLDLSLEVLEDAPDVFSFRLGTQTPLPVTPVLSLYVTAAWISDAARLFSDENGVLTPVGSVSLTGNQRTVLNVSLSAPGTYTILPSASGDTHRKEPLPQDPEQQTVDHGTARTCTLSIECSAIFNALDKLDPAKLDVLPRDGVILPPTEVVFYEGESVYDLLERVCREKGIHMEASSSPLYGSVYIEGIHNLYELDCGSGSGWMYRVNGWYPNYGSSRCRLSDGDVVEWRYSSDLGRDVGAKQVS